MRNELRATFISLAGLGRIVAAVPLPPAISLDISLGLRYFETQRGIWDEKRGSRHNRNYLSNTGYSSTQGRRYSRRMNSGARD